MSTDENPFGETAPVAEETHSHDSHEDSGPEDDLPEDSYHCNTGQCPQNTLSSDPAFFGMFGECTKIGEPPTNSFQRPRRFESPLDTLSMDDMMSFLREEDEKRTFSHSTSMSEMEEAVAKMQEQRQQEFEDVRAMGPMAFREQQQKFLNEVRQNHPCKKTNKSDGKIDLSQELLKDIMARLDGMESLMKRLDDKLQTVLSRL